jgi:hypothetical protein
MCTAIMCGPLVYDDIYKYNSVHNFSVYFSFCNYNSLNFGPISIWILCHFTAHTCVAVLYLLLAVQTLACECIAIYTH